LDLKQIKNDLAKKNCICNSISMQVLYFGKEGCILNGGIIQVMNLQNVGLDFNLQVIKNKFGFSISTIKKTRILIKWKFDSEFLEFIII